MSTKHEVAVELAGGKRLVFETGRMAKQASGAALVTTGETVVLATAVASPDTREGIDFFPLTVDYREYTYAGGRIPGGFIKREGRPSEKEILTCRQIDRPAPPALSRRLPQRDADDCAGLFRGQGKRPRCDRHQRRGRGCGALRHSLWSHGRRGARGPRQWRVRRQSHLCRARSDDSEHHGGRPQGRHRDDRVGGQRGDRRGHSGRDRVCSYEIKKIVAAIDDLVAKAGKPKRAFTAPEFDEAYYAELKAKIGDRLKDALDTKTHGKTESYALIKQIKDELAAELPADEPEAKKKLAHYYEHLRERLFREQVTKERIRPDRRAFDEIRPITIETGVLPRTHGSALFTRGETQALVTATLGTTDEGQRLETYEGEISGRTLCSTTTFRRSAWAKPAA